LAHAPFSIFCSALPGSFGRHANNAVLSDGDPLDLVQRNFILPSIIQFGCPRRLVIGDLLRDFECAAILEVRSDAGGAKGVVADLRFDASSGGSPLNDAVGVLCQSGLPRSTPAFPAAV
jgi:hypothetical protein